MSKANARSRWTLPTVVDPPEKICFQVMVPNNLYHIAAFKGAMFELAKAYSWGNDPAHTALNVAAVWRKIFDNLTPGDCAKNTIIFEDFSYDMSICEQLRFQDGKLQALCCGEWQDIDGQGDSTLGGSGQPGDGSTQPAPGETECYSGRLLGTGLWYLPTNVSTGDTIEITDPSGSWHDGAFSVWRCPDGNIFFAGGCIASTATDGGDPLPAQPHMSLIANIGGTFYPVLTGGVFTVPGGVSNSPVTFQANDGTLTDNAGEIAFKACVKNNQAGTFSHLFKMYVNPEGWAIVAPAGTFVPGTGFETVNDGPDGFGHYFRSMHARVTFPARTLTRVKVTGDITKGSTLDSSAYLVTFYDPSTNLFTVSYAAGSNGAGQHWEWTGSDSANQLDVQILVGIGSSDPGGVGIFTEVLVEGLGSDPF